MALLSCIARINAVAFALAVCCFLPRPVHADWSYIKSLFPDSSKQSPAAEAQPPKSPAPPVARQDHQPKKPAPVATEPLPLPPPAPVVRSSSSTVEAKKVLTPLPRELAPFSPGLSLRSQLLSVDSEWRGAVLIDGGITVAPAATLTILPGTVIRFAQGSGIHVLGRIVIQGSAESPVRLTSLYGEPQDSDWSGLFLSGTDKRNLLEHVVIEGAATAVFARFATFTANFVDIGSSAVGYRLQSSLATITNGEIAAAVTAVAAAKSELFIEKSVITGGQSGIVANAAAVEARDLAVSSCRLTALVASDSQLKLDKCSLSECQTALQLTRCDGTVSDSSFSGNRETGVILTASHLRFTGNTLKNNRVGLQLDDSLAALWGNVVSANSSYNLIYLGEESLFAGGNSFGGKTTAEYDNKIFSKRPGAVQLVPVFAIEP